MDTKNQIMLARVADENRTKQKEIYRKQQKNTLKRYTKFENGREYVYYDKNELDNWKARKAGRPPKLIIGK